ncbi:hypothetical protein REPUB_Repub07fG0165900 [Reevesia pubescens]
MPPSLICLHIWYQQKKESRTAKKKIARVLMAMSGLGSKGNKIYVLNNHFKMNVGSANGNFLHHCVSLFMNRSLSRW